jgi:SAM-dependent methyltransferase
MSEPTYVTDTRASYNAIAADYAAMFRTEFDENVLGRALLTAFAEHVTRAGGGPVLELGSGPGQVTAYLRRLGLDAAGVELSTGMLAIARAEHPGTPFEEGQLAAVDRPDGSLAGLVAWYSIIHTPPQHHPALFAEFHRVLAPGGYLLLGFQTGEESRRITEVAGKTIALEFHRLDPQRVTADLEGAGLHVFATLRRDAERGEKTPQAHLLARKQ